MHHIGCCDSYHGWADTLDFGILAGLVVEALHMADFGNKDFGHRYQVDDLDDMVPDSPSIHELATHAGCHNARHSTHLCRYKETVNVGNVDSSERRMASVSISYLRMAGYVLGLLAFFYRLGILPYPCCCVSLYGSKVGYFGNLFDHLCTEIFQFL